MTGADELDDADIEKFLASDEYALAAAQKMHPGDLVLSMCDGATPNDRLAASAAAMAWLGHKPWGRPRRPQSESPIEERLVDAMYAAVTVGLKQQVRQQVVIGLYRVDFIIGPTDGWPSVVVECDGKDFHDRTGGQADNDRRRDRALQARGLAVLRYSGAEITRSPTDCAMEAAEILKRRLKIADQEK